MPSSAPQTEALPAPAAGSLYDVLAAWQGQTPWGRVLDAGSGVISLGWLLGQKTRSWTAVSADTQMHAALQHAAGARQRPQDCIVLGNWTDEKLLRGQQFDTVLADYLIGALEGFAPYWQESLFARLRPLVRQRLYIIGLEPYVPYWPPAENGAARLVCEIGRLRDSCLLLAGQRPYREYPADWALRQLRQAGFHILQARHFAGQYGAQFIHNHLGVCAQCIAHLQDRNLAAQLTAHMHDVQRRAQAWIATHGALVHGNDYVIAAQPA